MPNFRKLQIPPPQNWEDFENLCYDLWKRIWKDPNTQKNGRSGQPQTGVDVFGRPNNGNHWAGIQCKGKDNILQKRLTEAEINDEVEKAKAFIPKLSQFIIATTSPRDEKLQKKARLITERHLKVDLFPVRITFWDDILIALDDYPQLVEKYCLGVSAYYRGFKDQIDDIQGKVSHTNEYVSSLNTHTRYQAELNVAESLINKHAPSNAIDVILKVKSDIWSTCSRDFQFRILTLLGSAELKRNKIPQAINYFASAYNLNPKNEKSVCNYALSHILSNRNDKALDLLTDYLQDNPFCSRAIALRIHSLPRDSEFELVKEQVPESIRLSPKVAYALSNLAWDYEEKDQAVKWLQTAVENDTASNPCYKAALGTLIIEIETQTVLFKKCNQVTQFSRETVISALDYLEVAIAQVKQTECLVHHLDWIHSAISAYRIIGLPRKAEEYINLALTVSPDDLDLLVQKCTILYERGKLDDALEVFESNPGLRESVLHSYFYSEILFLTGDKVKALKVLNKVKLVEVPVPIRTELGRHKIRLLSENGKVDDALLLLEQLRSTVDNHILLKIDEAMLARKRGDLELASSILSSISNNSSMLTPREHKELAEEFFEIEHFKLAACHYEQIALLNELNDVTKRLIEALYRDGQIGKALKLCKGLRNKHGITLDLASLEIRIYQEIDDYENSYTLGKELIRLFPEDINLLINFGGVLLQAKMYQELDKILCQDFDIDRLGLHSGLYLTHLLNERGQIKRAFDLIYQLRRRNFHNPEVHLKYIGVFMLRDNAPWLDHEFVKNGSVVFLEDLSEQTSFYIIEENSDFDRQNNEIELNDSFSRAMLGKKVGDVVFLDQVPKPINVGKIVEIKSKYVHAFQESIREYHKLFNNHDGFWRIDIDPKLIDSNPQEAFANLKPFLVDSNHDGFDQVKSLYSKRYLTIGSFARLIGQNYFDVVNLLQSNGELGVISAVGTEEERSHARSTIENQKHFVIDPITMILIHQLSIADVVVKTLKSVIISQSSINSLQKIRNEKNRHVNTGRSYIGLTNGIPHASKESGVHFKEQVDFLNVIIEFAENNFDIVPCRAALKIDRKRREQLDKIFGEAFTDSLLLASEEEFALYSDDQLLRGLGNSEFSINGTWTQVVLMNAMEKGVISEDDYCKHVIDLIVRNHRHLSINSIILKQALALSEQAFAEPFSTVVTLLGSQHCDEQSALRVTSEFLSKTRVEQICGIETDNIALATVRSAFKGRDFNKSYRKLLKLLSARLHMAPIHLRDLLNLLEVWRANGFK